MRIDLLKARHGFKTIYVEIDEDSMSGAMYCELGWKIRLGSIVRIVGEGLLLNQTDSGLQYLAQDLSSLVTISERSSSVYQVGAQPTSKGGWKPFEEALHTFYDWLLQYDRRCIELEDSFWNCHFFNRNQD